MYFKIRYVMQCERMNSHQGFDVNKMVHIAMEKCFVGKMVYLTFCLSTTKNSSQIQLNVLPTSQTNKFNKNSKIPELLANGICGIQNEKECRSVVNIFSENLKHFERSILSDTRRISGNCSADDSSHSTGNGVLLDKTDSDMLNDTVSPHNLIGTGTDGNNFVLSMLSGDGDKLDFSRDSVSCIELHRSDLPKESFSLNDLQQSVCYQSSTNDPRLLTNVREDKHSSNPFQESQTLKDSLFSKSQSEKENLIPARLSTSTADFILSYVVKPEATCGNEGSLEQEKALKLPTILTHSPNVSNGYNEFDLLFDSPTGDDLDAFLAEISFTRISTKSEQIGENQNELYCKEDKRCSFRESDPPSDVNMVCCGHKPDTYLTSTPNLSDPTYQRNSDLGSVTFSPICSVLIPSPERNSNDMQLAAAKRSLSSTPNPQSECISDYSCSLKSWKTSCRKSSHKVSSRIRANKKATNLLRGVLSPKKSTRCSNTSLLKSSVNVSQEDLNDSPVASPTPLAGDATPFEKWTDKSSLIFGLEKYVNEAEAIKLRGKFDDLPVNSVPPCDKSESEVDKNTPNFPRTDRYRKYSKHKLLSTFDSPLLFSPRTSSD